MTEQRGSSRVKWNPPRPITSVLEDGRPRPQAGTPSGFDLSWMALDALAASKASGRPCEIVLTGYIKRDDGVYWYGEAVNPAYLEEVAGLTLRGGKHVAVCPECDGYPRHARGCSLGS